MKEMFYQRASAVLYNYLVNIDVEGIFLLPANICPIVPMVFIKANVKFEFLDVNIEDACIDINEVIELSKNTEYAGVLYVYAYGIEKNLTLEFTKLKNSNMNFIIIEDKCLCVPTFMKNNYSDLEIFSTGYSKVIDIGFGGYGLVLNNEISENYNDVFEISDLHVLESGYKEALKRKIKYIYSDSNWLDSRKPDISFQEYKEKVLSLVNKIIEEKTNKNTMYKNGISNKLINVEYAGIWRYNIISSKKEMLISSIFSKGYFASGHYSNVSGLFGTNKYPNTEKIESCIINLFNDKYIDEDQIQGIISIINEVEDEENEKHCYFNRN